MQSVSASAETGLIAWFAKNHVAANLLMWFIIISGAISLFSIRKQTTPDFELNWIQVQVPYLGAAPQEVEEGVVIKIEEAIQDIQGIVEMNSRANEGLGSVTIEVSRDFDINEVLTEVKTRVDAISTFPGLTEKPSIYKIEPDTPVIFVAIHGAMDDVARKLLAQQVRNDLLAMPEISKVDFYGDRAFEISVEVSEHVLLQYGLTMTEISEAIRASSVDLPGGTIKTEGGDILLRTEGQVYTGLEYADLVLRTFPDGTRLTLGDIATIRDGFVESEGFGRFDGEPTATLNVLASGQQNELKTAAAVKEYVNERRESLPPGVKIDLWVDRSHYLSGRLKTMTKNLWQGALLVFLVLSLFLRMKVAGWVIIGIPITFLGAFLLMPHGPWPVTINMISLFGFIVVLGIVVDDAIIIGESIYTKIRADGHTIDNVIKGAKMVAVPATFGVLTTIAAFAPMLFVGGIVGPFFEALSMIVVLCLIFSLIESKLILPAHLVHANIKPVDEEDLFNPQREISLVQRVPRSFQKLQRHVQHGLYNIIHKRYRPALEKVLDNRGVVVALFSGVFIVTVGLISSGLVRVVLFPEVPGDFVRMDLEMESGTAPEIRNDALTRIERAILDLNDEYIAENPDLDPMISHIGSFTTSDIGATAFAEMPMVDGRALQISDVTALWRERIGDIAGVRELTFSDGQGFGGGPPLSFRLSGENIATLEAAAAKLELKLAEYDGVFDIRNSAASGGQEIRLSIKPEAEALGLTQASLGRQVRQAFYGEEAQRIQRGKDELKVMVRYPREERRSIADLENMRIRTPSGDEVPFESVAEVSFDTSYSTITRLNRSRTVTVSADMDPEIVEPGKLIKEISENFVPQLLSEHAGVSYGLEGASKEEQEFIANLSIASIAALFLIYALIAIPLHSYSQPLIIMSVIPFGLIGAVIGHIVMGKAVSMFSLFGLIALAGVVVNDSLIMVDFINKARAQGVPVRQAVLESGTQRFRAIILTSFTTAAGLMPILFETSVQAQYMIPMAVSLSFGILFATAITLFLIPSLYMLQLDGFARGRKIRDWLLAKDGQTPDSKASAAG
ncbi:MAG: efflux RND transporter permease subunit [Woeseiaceae bacterium]|nr:efflux RND transporter permease subunit [Woeseiaceae bacterium]